jgi:hypothetical protein
LTILGQAAGGWECSSRNGAILFGFDHTGYPLTLPWK